MAHTQAGKPAPREIIVQYPQAWFRLITPNNPTRPTRPSRSRLALPAIAASRLNPAFNEDAHSGGVPGAVEYRQQQGISGPLFIGKDTHALSEPAEATSIEVFAANGIEIRIPPGYTPPRRSFRTPS